MLGHSSPAGAPAPVRRGSVVLVLIVLLSLVLVTTVVVVRHSLQTREAGGFASSEPLILPGSDVGPAEFTNTLQMQFVRIPAGEFVMGATASEEFADVDERSHRVRISEPFYLGAHEVTVGQFRRFVEATGYKTDGEQGTGRNLGFSGTERQFDLGPYNWRDPGFPQEDNSPVVLVSWNDAAQFCHWLSRQEQRTYRLPTEAEWEWACRAGTTTRYSSGNDETSLAQVANVHTVLPMSQTTAVTWGDGYLFTLPVGTFRPNSFGVYDMHGNVQEWCADWYERHYYAKSPKADPRGPSTGTERAVRGGSYQVMAWHARSANRSGGMPSYRYYDLGFRVASNGP